MSNNVEHHPWPPFLPANARVLLLGSFPPPRTRWSMDFYYPNISNDFWKMAGLIFFDDPAHFIIKGEKAFDRTKIEAFLNEKGIALYDAATAVRRKKGNASDLHLEIVEPTNIPHLLRQIPHCHTIAVTGEKSAFTVLAPYDIAPPPIGGSVAVPLLGNRVKLYRMPSTSRAYPIALEKKASFYRQLFIEAGIIAAQ
ncbi:MAG: uracil-DNA glycosylase family protein [Bacteroidaceae bacterium]|nr:uracil-DNA glycosylase family protein [Bacteroidaceae bacterium]